MLNSKRSTTHIGALLIAAGLAGCGSEEASDTAETPQPVIEEAAWSYEGDTGPTAWGELSAEFATCASGSKQSPVNLAEADRTGAAEIELDYRPAAFEVSDVGHTVQADARDAGGITLDGESYELLQFHTHTPSEHTLEGEATDVGLHLVHQNDAGELAVIGVLADAGSGGALAEAFAQVPAEGETHALESFDPADLLPEDSGSFRYEGSLTTPPCTEGVSWIVMDQVTEVDPQLLAELQERYGENARPVQPLNDREVALDRG